MRKTDSLCDGWKFMPDAGRIDPALPFGDGGYETVRLPHCTNASDGMDGGSCRRGICAYQRTVRIPENTGLCFFLEFEGASAVCRAYLNGRLLGEHRGGYSAFRFEITEECTPGGEDLLTVLVDNGELPDVSPLGGDFTMFGGLYRPVSLVSVPAAHFDLMYHGTPGVLITPQVAGDGTGLLTVEPRVIHTQDVSLCYEIIAPDGSTAARRETGSTGCATLSVPNPVLWDGTASPALYTFRARLTGAENAAGESDGLTLQFGFRSFCIDPDRGFFLNGRHLPLHGVAKHQDRADVGNAVSRAQLDEDFALIREIGANTVRLSHYQHPQYFYDLCDRAGLIVWTEIPMLTMEPDNEALIENAKMQLTELILQNRHHPAVCFFGLQNEIAITGENMKMYRRVEELHRLAKELDPARLTAGANLYCVKNNSPLNQITDIVAYNLYYGWYYGEMPEYAGFLDGFHADYPEVPLGISEYGVDANPAFHSDTPRRKDYSEEFQCLFHETVYPVMAARPFVWGTYIWNMFDFGSAHRREGGTSGLNCKGLVSYDRKLRKDAFYFYKAHWSDEPFVHINSRRYYDRAAERITVRVYSNQTHLRLIVNGTEFAAREGRHVFEFPDVPLVPGVNTVTAECGCCRDTVEWNRTPQPNPAYAYIDPNPEYNVRNWFTPGQTEEDLFPTDRYSLMDTVGGLLACPETKALIEELLPELTGNPLLERAGSFTLFKILNRMSGSISEERAQEINRRLRGIPK